MSGELCKGGKGINTKKSRGREKKKGKLALPNRINAGREGGWPSAAQEKRVIAE